MAAGPLNTPNPHPHCHPTTLPRFGVFKGPAATLNDLQMAQMGYLCDCMIKSYPKKFGREIPENLGRPNKHGSEEKKTKYGRQQRHLRSNFETTTFLFCSTPLSLRIGNDQLFFTIHNRLSQGCFFSIFSANLSRNLPKF